MGVRIGVVSVLVVLACRATFGQASTQVSFEVASLRRVNSGAMVPLRGGPGSADPGRVSARNITLKILLQRAFDPLKPDQVFGPTWIDTERYDLTATVPMGATKEQSKLMLQNLLVERFHLTLHHETRTFSGYRLVIAKNGARLKESDTSAGGARGVSSNISSGKAHVVCRAASMANFADSLGGSLIPMMSGPAGLLTSSTSHVADLTGLTAFYDFTLDYATSTPADSVPDGADLFTALQQQLGLKLEEAKLPLDVIVIDQADRTPIEN